MCLTGNWSVGKGWWLDVRGHRQHRFLWAPLWRQWVEGLAAPLVCVSVCVTACIFKTQKVKNIKIYHYDGSLTTYLRQVLMNWCQSHITVLAVWTKTQRKTVQVNNSLKQLKFKHIMFSTHIFPALPHFAFGFSIRFSTTSLPSFISFQWWLETAALIRRHKRRDNGWYFQYSCKLIAFKHILCNVNAARHHYKGMYTCSTRRPIQERRR